MEVSLPCQALPAASRQRQGACHCQQHYLLVAMNLWSNLCLVRGSTYINKLGIRMDPQGYSKQHGPIPSSKLAIRCDDDRCCDNLSILLSLYTLPCGLLSTSENAIQFGPTYYIVYQNFPFRAGPLIDAEPRGKCVLSRSQRSLLLRTTIILHILLLSENLPVLSSTQSGTFLMSGATISI